MIPNDEFESYPLYQRAEMDKDLKSTIETYQLCIGLMQQRPEKTEKEKEGANKPSKKKKEEVLPIFLGTHLATKIRKNFDKRAHLIVCVKEFQSLVEEFHLLLETNRERIYENKRLRKHLEELMSLIETQGIQLNGEG